MIRSALCLALILSGIAQPAGGADFEKLDSAVKTPQAKRCILRLARGCLESEVLAEPMRPINGMPKILTDGRAGAFVTLESGGRLRSCWGSVWPTQKNLAEEIEAAARGAAASDPRFKPVHRDELGDIVCTVSIVGEPQTVRRLLEIRPAQDGVLVRKGQRSGVALPHEGKTVSYLLEIARTKAGISDGEEYEILRFRTIRIKETPREKAHTEQGSHREGSYGVGSYRVGSEREETEGVGA